MVKVKAAKTATTSQAAAEAVVETVIPEQVSVSVEDVNVAPAAAPKKRVKKVTKVKTEVVETETIPAAAAPVVEESVIVVDALEVEAEVEAEPEVEEVVEVADKKKRRAVTKDRLLEEYEELKKELVPILEAGNQKKILKLFKTVVADTYRLLKIKTAQKRQKDATNSGFMRPVKPSVALETFLTKIKGGEKSTEPLTRAHLTTMICKYIKEKDLQNPKDRRIIFPDEELKSLFQITEGDTEPLTYYNIQKRIQPHVSRIEDVVPITESVEVA